jgi:hypothetical protein
MLVKCKRKAHRSLNTHVSGPEYEIVARESENVKGACTTYHDAKSSPRAERLAFP